MADPNKKLIVEKKANMLLPRQAFGLCAVNNFIFVGGCVVGEDQYTSTCDRYDVLTDKWKKLDCCNLPARMYA